MKIWSKIVFKIVIVYPKLMSFGTSTTGGHDA